MIVVVMVMKSSKKVDVGGKEGVEEITVQL